MQASWARSSWLMTFFSSGCFNGSLVQLHSLSFPRFFVTITLLKVCFGGGLGQNKQTNKKKCSLIPHDRIVHCNLQHRVCP